MIRAMDRDVLTIPAESGAPVEVRVQGCQLRAEAGPDGATVALPPLFFGNRTEVRGSVWRGKARETLMVERR